MGVASLLLACSVNVSAGAGTPDGGEVEQDAARPDTKVDNADDTDPSDAPAEDEPGSSASNMKEVAAGDPPAEKTSCTTAADCGEGMVCEGEGCGEMQGVCAPKDRMCTRDLQTYCGCDGAEFQSSGSCPGDRYRNRGACEAPS